MADTENPEIKAFRVLDPNGQDQVLIYLGPDLASISTSKWPKDQNGIVTDIGTSQTIHMSRHALIGLAYEILQAVK